MSTPAHRRRLIVALSTLGVCIIALLGYLGWRRSHPRDAYAQMVSAFYTGVIAMNVGDDVHAASGLATATGLFPSEPAGWANLGLFALRHRNGEQARAALTKAQSLAPNNGQIAALLGLLETQEGHYTKAVTAYQKAVAADPTSLRSRYALEEALQQAADPHADAEGLTQFQAIYDAVPQNLFAEFTLAIAVARAGDSAKLRRLVAKIASHAGAWSPEQKSSLQAVQAAAAGTDPRAAVLPLLSLQHQLIPLPQYQDDALQIQGDQNTLGLPLETFLTLPSPSPTPAAPDRTTVFSSQPLLAPAGVWRWAQRVPLSPDNARMAGESGDAASTLLLADGRTLQVGKTALPFPGGPSTAAPTPSGVAVLDFSNDFQMDIACAGAGGLRLYQQGTGGVFTDVTAEAKLPPEIVNGDYRGLWTADIDTDGDLDLIVGTQTGKPLVLRNNGDGTWNVLHPFGTAHTGLTQWEWADVDGDGSPDPAFLDGQGRLTILHNGRSGVFTPMPLPAAAASAAALSAADSDRNGTQDFTTLTADGTVRRLSRRIDGSGWEISTLARTATPPPADGSARLWWADLDNNGSLDLVVTGSAGTQVFLGDGQDKLAALPGDLAARTVTVDAQATKDRLDLVGLNPKGQPVRLVNTGAKSYKWQEIRLRAKMIGDKRNNTYGIGSEISLRARLLYENQIVTGPVIHFGLGENEKSDYIRIAWTNGVPQGEFDLHPIQMVEVTERLKGSCPWLFADNGTGATADAGMHFVTDLIWRSPLGLRINAQDTAGVVQTRDWIKIRGDQLKPRDGSYNLRVTADLWETHFFDELTLMTVDHPVGTDVFVDERFSIPPPPLAVHPLSPPVPAVRAIDDRGRDVTDSIRAKDGRYLDTFGRGNYQGVTRDHWVQLDLGPNPAASVLVGSGWVHPTDSSINLALGQGHHAPPHDLDLEIPDGHGGWKVAKAHLGFPEGKFKTVLIDLAGVFPPGIPHQVRLRTNLEIYWDFLGTATPRPQTPLKTQTLAASEAALRFRGFSVTHQPNPSSPEVPDYTHLGGTAPRWIDLAGYYTRFGNVRPLLRSTDDRYVIMNAGDEMVLRFPAPAPPPPGWTRDFVLIGDGWIKDGDFNTGFSRTVLPLPAHSRPAYNIPPRRLEDDPVYKTHRADWATYQTRWVSPQTFRTEVRRQP